VMKSASNLLRIKMILSARFSEPRFAGKQRRFVSFV